MRVLTLFLMLTTIATAGETVIESPPVRVHLVELFTSEGCSSCPPADAWLSGLKEERGLWREFVPVAFHVDYWDRLGWKDRLASPLFTQRQNAYATAWRARSVYTPGFVVDGREWRGRELPRASGKKAGVLRVRVAADRVSVSFPRDARKLSAHVAWLAGEVETDVKAGENRGRKLRHDFTALSIESQPIDAATGSATFAVAKPSEAKAVAAWITETGLLEPVQAAGGPLSPR
jgi:hypothetical protein